MLETIDRIIENNPETDRKKLEECIKSYGEQSVKDIFDEMVVVDSPGTDALPYILDKLNDIGSTLSILTDDSEKFATPVQTEVDHINLKSKIDSTKSSTELMPNSESRILVGNISAGSLDIPGFDISISETLKLVEEYGVEKLTSNILLLKTINSIQPITDLKRLFYRLLKIDNSPVPSDGISLKADLMKVSEELESKLDQQFENNMEQLKNNFCDEKDEISKIVDRINGSTADLKEKFDQTIHENISNLNVKINERLNRFSGQINKVRLSRLVADRVWTLPILAVAGLGFFFMDSSSALRWQGLFFLPPWYVASPVFLLE